MIPLTARRRLGLLLAAAVAATCAPAVRADSTVTLTLSSRTTYVNSGLSVGIKIENAQDLDTPAFPELADCTVRYVGVSSAYKISAVGARSRQVKTETYNFQITPHKSGSLTIPAIPVHVDGKMLLTKPATINVLDIPESPTPRENADGGAAVEDRLLAEITCDEDKLYVGQTAKFTLTIWVKAAKYNGRVLSSSDMFGMVTGNFRPFDVSQGVTNRINKRLDDGAAAVYYVVELPAELEATQPGPMTFDEVSAGVDYPIRFTRSRSMGLFGGGVRVAESTPIRIRPRISAPDVLPLPTANRPADFNGLIGRYTISTFAAPTNVRVGDPIQLVIDVSGAPIVAAPGPVLAEHARLTENFRVSSETLAGVMLDDGKKRFTQIIRAKRPDVEYIPAIELPYFDPVLGDYVVAKSEPVPVLVSMSEQLDAADLTDISSEPAPTAQTQLETRDGLRGNKTDLNELLAAAPLVAGRDIILAVGAPPAVFVCLLGVSALARGRRDEAARRRRAALPKAERRIQAALKADTLAPAFHCEIEAALTEYLADRLDLPAARLLGPAAVELLNQRGVKADVVQLWTETRQACELAAYAGGDERDVSLAEEARRCLRLLAEETL